MGGGTRTPLELGSTGEAASEAQNSRSEGKYLGAERVGRHKGVRIVPAARHGSGRRRGHGGLDFVPSAVSDWAGWHEPLRVKYMCDQKCNKEGFKFHDIAAILVEDDGKPHTINLCRNYYSPRLAERNESVVTNVRWKAMFEQKVSRQTDGRLRVRGFRQKDVWSICSQKTCGHRA